MSEPIQTKRCSKCKQFKQFSEFYKDRTRKDGHCNKCKSCNLISVTKYQNTEKGKVQQKRYGQSNKGKIVNRKAVRKYRKTDKFKATYKHYRQSEKGKATKKHCDKHFRDCHPNQRKAVSAVNHAIRDGKLPRPDSLLCHYCPKPAQEYHHWHGYEPKHWLDVVPVCKYCHVKEQKRQSGSL